MASLELRRSENDRQGFFNSGFIEFYRGFIGFYRGFIEFYRGFIGFYRGLIEFYRGFIGLPAVFSTRKSLNGILPADFAVPDRTADHCHCGWFPQWNGTNLACLVNQTFRKDWRHHKILTWNMLQFHVLQPGKQPKLHTFDHQAVHGSTLHWVFPSKPLDLWSGENTVAAREISASRVLFGACQLVPTRSLAKSYWLVEKLSTSLCLWGLSHLSHFQTSLFTKKPKANTTTHNICLLDSWSILRCLLDIWDLWRCLVDDLCFSAQWGGSFPQQLRQRHHLLV